jgi:hypothetical protein
METSAAIETKQITVLNFIREEGQNGLGTQAMRQDGPAENQRVLKLCPSTKQYGQVQV